MGKLGGLILSGLGNLFDFGLGGLSAEIQKKNQLEMMDKQHQYNLDTMRVQNEYQVEQWNRENEYNTPLNVANRFRAAGIAPQAVFGSGAQGAGIAGGLSSAPSGGSPSGSASAPSRMTDTIGGLSALSQLVVNESVSKVNDAQARLLDAKAKKERSETPTFGSLGDSKKANLDSQTALNDMLYQTEQEKQKKLISDRDYNVAKTALTRAQTTQQEWSNKFDKETYGDRVQSLRYDLLSAVQAYNFNDSKNPLILKDLKLNIATQTMGLLATQVQMRLAEQKINLTQHQVLQVMAQSSLLTEQAKAVTAKVAMQKELQPYRKAQVISGIVNASLGTIIDGVKVFMTGGLAPTGSKNNGDNYESKLPSSVNGTDIDDFLLNVAAF